MPKILGFKFQSHSIKIEDFKINPINLLTLLAPRGGVKILYLFLGMSYIMPKKLSSEFQGHSIKIENFKINPINPFIPNKTKGGGNKIFKPIARNVL